MTTVHLVRHAAHDRIVSVLCGRMPGVTLGPLGRDQAAMIALRLARSQAVAVLTSPRERAVETAGSIAEALGLQPEIALALDEIDVGDWTGRRFDSLATDPAWRVWNQARGSARPPGGESMAEAQSRVVALLARLAERDIGPIILVSHGDIIRAAILAMLDMPLDAYHRIEVDPASISTIEIWPGGGKLVGLNEGAQLWTNPCAVPGIAGQAVPS